MVDDVAPLAEHERIRMSTYNGTGFDLKGFTRRDAAGWSFATRYFCFFGLPVAPVGRYYLRQVSVDYQNYGPSSRTTTRYQIVGRSRLRALEVLRTYAYCWLFAPGLVLVPIGFWLGNADALADSIGFWWVMGGFLFWLIASIVILAVMLGRYQKHWAPVRVPRWTSPPVLD